MLSSRHKGDEVIGSHRVRHTCCVALIGLLAVALPATGWAWGSVGHHYIAENYSKHLPPYIDGMRTYDSTVDTHVTDPDTRKGSVPGESYRHYIDIDSYPEFLAGTLARDRTTLEAEYGASTVLNNGVLPWAVSEVVATLTTQFQAQNWYAAALTIADLCHYVGDSQQPLHVTKNYDGQLSGNSGIHSRYESTMISDYLGQLHTPTMTVQYYASPQDAIFDGIAAAYADVAPILTADTVAKAASGGSYNSTYYASLWNSTKVFTQARLDTASVMTASFVYTAWVNAGSPIVPGSTAGVPPGLAAGVQLQAGPSPFRDALTVRFSGPGPLSVEVFDVRGARVARLADGVSGAGSVTWRPGSAGAPSGPGLYFVRLHGPEQDLVRRVTLVQ